MTKGWHYRYQHGTEQPALILADHHGNAPRLDALRNNASTANGNSNRPDFTCSAKVAITEHDNPNLNRDWLLTAH